MKGRYAIMPNNTCRPAAPDVIELAFAIIEPALTASGFRIDDGDNDTVCLTHIESKQALEIRIIKL